jgi:hypothetical protein
MMKAYWMIGLGTLAIYLSPGARSWLGGLLMLVGEDLVDSCPDVMSDEEHDRVWKRVMREVEREAERPSRNGDRP